MDYLKGSLPTGIVILPEYVVQEPMSMQVKRGDSTGICTATRPDGQPLFIARKQIRKTYESIEYFDAVTNRNLFELRSHHSLMTKTWTGYANPGATKLFDLTLKSKGVAILVNYTDMQETRLTLNYTPAKVGESATMTCDGLVAATIRSERSTGTAIVTTQYSVEGGMDPLVVLAFETVSYEKAMHKSSTDTMFADFFVKTFTGLGASS